MSKFIRNFSLELSESDLKELIKDAAERETGRKVISISFSISAGYQDRFESSSPCLNSVTVKLGEEIVVDKPTLYTGPWPPKNHQRI